MIDTAILLAAGEGSRLRGATPLKPLCPVAGRTLIDHALTGLGAAGIARVVVVTGYGADAVEEYLRARHWPVIVETVRSGDWRLPNGVSVRAAAPVIEGQALLAMCDHLVAPALYRRMAEAGAGEGLRLGIDRRLGHPFVDPLDVTCVRTMGDRIVAIGKGLEPHDCYDTGVFAVGPSLFDVLGRMPAPSLTDGVRALAATGRARVVDCGDLDWIDVDDPTALAEAERLVA
ncbi:NTP transferase domain-containing protein [uncultured Sphingomonas sp.]|uniref:phosphocholine cytidylyltransferase family protein n=1 Tax=uncultured Sphingomonas sp. TaxID=158754 RepID=UPI0035CA1FF7